MIKLKNTPEQVELVKAIGSKDNATSRQASEAFAAAIGSVIKEVLAQAGTASLIYVDQSFMEDESPSYPLDLYYNEDAGYITTWSQSMAGGLPSSEVSGVAEMKIATYRLDSAVNFLKKYARKHNLNVLSKAVERMIQEVLIKQERQAWAVIMRALAEASTKVNGTATAHILSATTANRFQLDDLNRLLTLAKRINASFAGGTAVSPFSRGITDLFVSPEIKQEVRSFVYQPMNTQAVPNTDESTAIPLPDAIRQSIYAGGGIDGVFGIALTELNELGDAQKYNTIFKSYYTSTFVNATDQILVGIDLSKDAFIRPIATDANNGATFVVSNDDQWVSRSERVGFYGACEQGNICIDGRATMGLIV